MYRETSVQTGFPRNLVKPSAQRSALPLEFRGVAQW